MLISSILSIGFTAFSLILSSTCISGVSFLRQLYNFSNDIKSDVKYLRFYAESNQILVTTGFFKLSESDKVDILKKYVLEALNDKKSNKYIYLGVIPKETIVRIKNEVTDIKQNKINSYFVLPLF